MNDSPTTPEEPSITPPPVGGVIEPASSVSEATEAADSPEVPTPEVVAAPDTLPQPEVTPTPEVTPPVSVEPEVKAPEVVQPQAIVGNVETGTQISAPADKPPANIYSYNSMKHARVGKSRRGLTLLITGLILIGLIGGGYVYFWMLPARYADNYLSAVRPAYNNQSAKMKTAFDSFKLPILSSKDTTEDSDKKDLETIKSATDAALSSTSTLKSKNQLKTLPGTAWTSKTKEANQKYEAMQKYVTDSDNFLKDYQTLTSYVDQFAQLSNSGKLDAMFTQAGVLASARPNQVIPAVKAALAATSPVLSTLQQLNPPADLKQVSDDLVKDVNSLYSALTEIDKGIAGQNAEQINNGSVHFAQALASFSNIQNFQDAVDKLQTDSAIYSQITKLQAEKPL